ncbi:uncharacterized protein LOC115876327 [Sitophilus oryzae]|uniref:Uncharacterized protein LOC115876327 n=1 Tax=Sitophilus oryzae TaxID=7048 RepID=A0A6J2X9Q9_SITOR|nr:uncharacterized protein LOC115876327 [Sitophilus oryzae]
MILKMDMSHSAFPTVNSLSPPNSLLLRRPNNADFNSVLSASLGSTTGFWNSPAHDPLVPGRVIASMDIPQGTMSLPIDPVSLMGNVDVQQISAGITFFGTLGLDKASKEIWNQPCHWVRAIRLAEDCHSYNVQLKLQPSYRIYPNIRKKPLPKLIIQVVRPISSGQELQLWFSEDILGMLQVVFLTPSNIQGQEKYICLRCSSLYESPNPLKLHITLACSKFPISSLWCRLADLMKESQSPQSVDIEGIPFDLKLSPDQQVARQKQALDLTTAGENEQGGHKQLYRPYIESAFKPFKRERSSLTRSPVIPDAHATPDLPTAWPNVFGSDIVQLHRNLMHSQLATPNQIPCTDDAQIESLVITVYIYKPER